MERLRGVEVPVLELLEPEINFNELPGIDLDEIEKTTLEAYEELVFTDPSRPIWEEHRLDHPLDITINVHWNKNQQHPLVGLKEKSGGNEKFGICGFSGASEWLGEYRSDVNRIFSNSNDLWIPHNWFFFRSHFYFGGEDGTGGKMNYYSEYSSEAFTGGYYVGKGDQSTGSIYKIW